MTDTGQDSGQMIRRRGRPRLPQTAAPFVRTVKLPAPLGDALCQYALQHRISVNKAMNLAVTGLLRQRNS